MPQSRHRRKGVTRPRVRHAPVKTPGCPACEDPDFSFEDELRRIRQLVERYGFVTQAILGDRAHPPYAYTVGLGRDDHPELVVVGLEPKTAHDLLWALAPEVLDGADLTMRSEIALPGTPRLRVVPARPGAVDLGVAELVDDAPADGLQLVWPDPAGEYPGEPSYDAVGFRQPLLGRAWWAPKARVEAV